KKIGLGPATHPLLKAMARGRKLRGTRLDPFGYAHVRRLERALRDHYEAMVLALAVDLTSANYDRAVAAAAAADLVRGYEHVKLGNVERYRDVLAALDLPRAVPSFPVLGDEDSAATADSKKAIGPGSPGGGDHAGAVPDEPQYG
ncbi:MAG: hypothetical protein REI45_12195, partial [Propionicimonas sp.]|nr:hypothetical protein [Propionicimonas sp.]